MNDATRLFDRRMFLRYGAATAATLAASPLLRARQPRPDDETVVSILHTTDLHGNILPTRANDGEADVGGFARCAARIRLWREENPNCLTLDLGDLYQGTEVGFRTRGRIMVDLLNLLQYDAWVIGNHEFDWGRSALIDAVQQSRMPVLSANAILGDGLDAALRIAPWIIRERAGFRIGILGLTTPGLPFWLPNQLLGGFQAADPVAHARRAVAELRARGVDAIVLATHMGLREQGDDYANVIQSVAEACPEIALILGAHTHRHIQFTHVREIPYSQANYWGIHVGRADLVFSKSTRRLVRVEPRTVKMDKLYDPDPAVLTLAARDLEASAATLATPIAHLPTPLRARGSLGSPGDVERLIADAILEALAARGGSADAVLHGTFSRDDVPAGTFTVADAWKLIPFDNAVVTAELPPALITAVLNEIASSNRSTDERNLMGMVVEYTGTGSARHVARLLDRAGNLLDPERRYRIAVNGYDAQSGARRLLTLRAVVEAPESRSEYHPINTREALATHIAARFPLPVPAA